MPALVSSLFLVSGKAEPAGVKDAVFLGKHATTFLGKVRYDLIPVPLESIPTLDRTLLCRPSS